MGFAEGTAHHGQVVKAVFLSFSHVDVDQSSWFKSRRPYDFSVNVT